MRRTARGQGLAVALVQAAVRYAAAQGARIVEAYPRAGAARAEDASVYFGTEPLFRRAGFRVARPPLPGLPRNWQPRLAMRIETAAAAKR
ncbi:MAG: N-acetyltransferase [Alphaproteobacteria bacterium]|nr:N-acetyltransferase [Alphaproteobacteria bacterium]